VGLLEHPRFNATGQEVGEADCDAAYAVVKRLRSKVEPKSDRGYSIVTITKVPTDIVASCFVRTQACGKASQLVWSLQQVANGVQRYCRGCRSIRAPRYTGSVLGRGAIRDHVPSEIGPA